MTGWSNDELTGIGTAEELQISPRRRDGTLRNPRTIWVVRVSDDLYVRSVRGRTSSWFRGAQLRHQAHIRAGGIDKDVVLVETDDMDDQIDAAYHTKYRRYAASIIDAIVSPEARAATLRLCLIGDVVLSSRAIAKSCGLTAPLEGATPSWSWSLVGGLEEALTVGADHLLEVVKGAFDGVDIKAHLGPLDG
jgi:hypothetical protein